MHYRWNLSTFICESKKYLKSIANTSVTDEIIIDIDIVSTKKTNNIATIVTNNALINCHSKKVLDRYIFSLISDHITIEILLANVIQNREIQYKMESNEY